MNFNVIIPVVNPDLCDEVITSMEYNTILPQKVIIIDNSDGRYIPESKKFPIYVFTSQTGWVNESWNLGITKVDITCDYVSILNDDIYLNSWFFQRVHETFQAYKDCGVACPYTVNNMRELGKGKRKPSITRLLKREGWAFTFKKSVLDIIPPIPDYRVKLFHGDDWFWFHSKTKGFCWYQDEGNIIYHQVGASIERNGLRSLKKIERNEWRKIMNELGG